MTNTFQITQLIREFHQANEEFTRASNKRELLARHLGRLSGVAPAWSEDSWNEIIKYIENFEAQQQVGPVCSPVPVQRY